MMDIKITSDETISDIKLIENKIHFDTRGSLSKIFFQQISESLSFSINEVFYSTNLKNVIRGIHFQNKIEELKKIITCVDGEILDFFIDLRPTSKTFGMYSSVNISSENGLSVYIPEGFGHGFSVLSQSATVLYLQSGNYNILAEEGINPLSIEFDWQVKNPILSTRDLNHPDYKFPI